MTVTFESMSIAARTDITGGGCYRGEDGNHWITERIDGVVTSGGISSISKKRKAHR
ncbi:hypothetical protein ACAX43_28500 [Paraburkholderia sp. IW21]|uniref:hypothetical protein n=1 Tax=Paraburkholderia sp. IW21 TaxID=3242488 RepID=UPI003521FE68